jgi:hypothetical protein
MKYIWEAIVDGPSIARIARASDIARMPGVADVAKIPQVLIHDHILMQLAYIVS